MARENGIDSPEKLRELVSASDGGGIETYIAETPTSDVLRAMLRLSAEEQEAVLTTLSPAEAADLVEEIPDEQAADIIETMAPSDAATIVSEMQSDEQADLLGDLDEEDKEAILQQMAPEQAENARELSSYEDDVAGGLMVREFLRFEESTTIAAVLQELSERSEHLEEYFTRYAYVVSAWGRLIGVVEVRALALSPRHRSIAEVMVPSLFVLDKASLDELREFFERRPFVAVPVVDRNNRLLGVVRESTVREALAERSEKEMLRMRGIVGGDEIRTLPMLTRARRRLSWLSVNIVLNILAASVIAVYIDTLEAVIALAVFLPIISDMSGCSGNQAVAVSMRELSLGLVKPAEVLRVWLAEISVGVLNGCALGILLGCVAWAWKGNPFLGLVVGSALMLNTLIAVTIGGTVPLILKRFGVDPAVASGPILTTVTDICGFFLVLSFAALMLTKLT